MSTATTPKASARNRSSVVIASLVLLGWSGLSPARAATKLVDLLVSEETLRLCPGESLKLDVSVVTAKGKTRKVGGLRHSWKSVNITTDLGRVKRGRLSFPADPDLTWGQTANLDLRIDGTDLHRQVRVEPWYECSYRVSFDGEDGEDGAMGKAGEDAVRAGSNGGSGGSGEHGRHGSRGDDVVVEVRMDAHPHTDQPVFRVAVRGHYGHARHFAVSPHGGSLLISANGGQGGDGGKGGKGGNAKGAEESGDGGDGGNGGNGGDGGDGGSITVEIDDSASDMRSAIDAVLVLERDGGRRGRGGAGGHGGRAAKSGRDGADGRSGQDGRRGRQGPM